VAQLVVIVDVLVTERDPEHPLPNQRHDFMLDQIRTARVMEAGGKPFRQLDCTICRPQQQRPGVGRHRTAIEGRNNFTPSNRCKSE
jgi:hypothetical protein